MTLCKLHKKEIEMTLKKSDIDIVRKQVKYPRIEINPGGKVKVVAPPGYDVDGFIGRKRGWIDGKLSKINGIMEKSKGKENMILLNGSFYKLNLGDDLGLDEGMGILTVPSLFELQKWITEKLRAELNQKSKLISKLMGVEYGRIYIRRQKTRWGSCSGRKNLNFNMSMMALPEKLREYIVVHEVSHLLERNHSKNFWKIVERQYPDYKNAREELKRYSLTLIGNEIWKKLMNLNLNGH